MDFTDLERKKSTHLLGGGKDKQKEQKMKNKMTAFERLNSLFDSETFVEIDQFVLHDCNEFGMEQKRLGTLAAIATSIARWVPTDETELAKKAE